MYTYRERIRIINIYVYAIAIYPILISYIHYYILRNLSNTLYKNVNVNICHNPYIIHNIWDIINFIYYKLRGRVVTGSLDINMRRE